jgi:hypothetical protein
VLFLLFSYSIIFYSILFDVTSILHITIMLYYTRSTKEGSPKSAVNVLAKRSLNLSRVL